MHSRVDLMIEPLLLLVTELREMRVTATRWTHRYEGSTQPGRIAVPQPDTLQASVELQNATRMEVR
jgi:hypothetical protein